MQPQKEKIFYPGSKNACMSFTTGIRKYWEKRKVQDWFKTWVASPTSWRFKKFLGQYLYIQVFARIFMIENILKYVSSVVLVAGGWNLANGILHDVFVLRSDHGRQYDRNLLRLLMDGHILITCGIILVIVSNGVRDRHDYAYWIAGTALISMIVYCLMIFPFLKSILTLLINSLALTFLIISFIKK